LKGIERENFIFFFLSFFFFLSSFSQYLHCFFEKKKGGGGREVLSKFSGFRTFTIFIFKIEGKQEGGE